MQEQQTAQEAGGVVASLDRIEGERRFVVQNMGDLSAHDVRLTVHAERDKNPPVSSSDLERIFPIAELQSGDAVSVGAIITPGTGLHFRCLVSWKQPDGTTKERVYYTSA